MPWPPCCSNQALDSATAWRSCSLSGSSSTGALAIARETGSSMASSRPTTALTWRGAKRSISSWACFLVPAMGVPHFFFHTERRELSIDFAPALPGWTDGRMQAIISGQHYWQGSQLHQRRGNEHFSKHTEPAGV